MLEGLRHWREHLREAMREATLPTFHRFTCGDLETFLGFWVVLFFVLFVGFGVVVLLSTFSRSL